MSDVSNFQKVLEAIADLKEPLDAARRQERLESPALLENQALAAMEARINQRLLDQFHTISGWQRTTDLRHRGMSLLDERLANIEERVRKLELENLKKGFDAAHRRS